jgi:hypothetical protein
MARAPKNVLEKLLDDIKDEIDTVHQIKSPRQRKAAAQDLADYLFLHHGVIGR